MRKIVGGFELQESCAFFQKAKGMEEKTMAGAFFAIYCKGPKEDDCVIRDLAGRPLRPRKEVKREFASLLPRPFVGQ